MSRLPGIVLSLALLLVGGIVAPSAHASSAGTTWTSQTSAANNSWNAVTWGGPAGQETFVAVSSTGTGNRVMTSGTFGGGGATSDPASVPAPIIQQFGKNATDTCDAVAPESLNWSAVAGGGWGESWAQWMNDGLGGAVCTRTLVYSTAQSRWVVG